MLADIRRLAGPTVTVLGSQPFAVLKQHYARCRALIFPGEEDFGMVPVEAMASGRPVIAYGRGGALETVADGVSGIFFETQTVEDISSAVKRFSKLEIDSQAIAAHAKRFGRDRFLQEIRSHISDLLAQRAARPASIERARQC
jgi:glycosyltransferase involved in cell wall biosynthesis